MSMRSTILTAAGAASLAAFLSPLPPQDTAEKVSPPAVVKFKPGKPVKTPVKAGALTVSADVTREKPDGPVRLVLRADNSGETAVKIPVRVRVYKRESSPYSRMPAIPVALLDKEITLDVPPGKAVDFPVDAGAVSLVDLLPGGKGDSLMPRTVTIDLGAGAGESVLYRIGGYVLGLGD